MNRIEVTMVVVRGDGDALIEGVTEVDPAILCGGARFAVITDLVVAEYEVFDYDESSKRLLVYQLSPIDTRPAEMRALADMLNPRQDKTITRTIKEKR